MKKAALIGFSCALIGVGLIGFHYIINEVNSPSSQLDDYTEVLDTYVIDTYSYRSYGPGLLDAEVLNIIDGETLQVRMEDGTPETIKLLQIEVPESGLSGTSMDHSAEQYLSSLLAGQQIGLDTDVTVRDEQGNLTASVFFGEMLINEELLKRGYAKVSGSPADNLYTEQYQEAEQAARSAKLGIWNGPAVPE
ncbi:thermonuclease family protein [Paenibacillus tengchongensis]|uniref:thermonuclease family protein n=1 Tax=Paenibacillus tengchongensis TaxID=2608684 RepID=UPI001FE828A7|nr:thermonuclease family protein [Paenibacillus tengchongensis]